jgi:hypothetical protein
MPVDWHVDHARRLVLTEAHGTLTGEEMLRYQREVWSRPDVAGYDELVDMSAVTDAPHVPNLAQELAALSATMDPASGRSKFAIVAPQQAFYGLARMYETYRGMEERSTKRVGVFRDRAEALGWLADVGPSPDAGRAELPSADPPR